MRRAPAALVATVLLASCKKPAPPTPEMAAPTAEPPKADAPPRCAPVSSEPPFALGPADTGRASAESVDAGEAWRDDSLPFAAEVGDGVPWLGGFAVGALHESEKSIALSVVTLDATGHNAKIVSLGVAHGDVDPPRLAAREGVLGAAIVEPSASGRTMRLGRIAEGTVTWGAQIAEHGGESQAFDFALGEKKGIVVWDEDGPSSSVIQVATFDSTTLANATPPRTISRAGADAEAPRLALRDGGYWLAYIATSAPPAETRPAADENGFRWIEVVPLDANGSPTAPPRVATPKDGHVMVFDFAPTVGPASGSAVLAYRYDDVPSGGEVMRVLVRPGNIEPPSALIDDRVGAGVPNLLPGWIAMLDAADATRLAPLGPDGQITGPFTAEPDIGSGEPIVGGKDRLLVARPSGRSVKLIVLACRPDPAGDR